MPILTASRNYVNKFFRRDEYKTIYLQEFIPKNIIDQAGDPGSRNTADG